MIRVLMDAGINVMTAIRVLSDWKRCGTKYNLFSQNCQDFANNFLADIVPHDLLAVVTGDMRPLDLLDDSD